MYEQPFSRTRINIFLAPTATPEVLYPESPAGLPEPGPELFAISSALPKTMVANARAAVGWRTAGRFALATVAGLLTWFCGCGFFVALFLGVVVFALVARRRRPRPGPPESSR